ncbi:MAG TPA: hypothetical protein VGC06_13870 [Actinomycetes bacterium]
MSKRPAAIRRLAVAALALPLALAACGSNGGRNGSQPAATASPTTRPAPTDATDRDFDTGSFHNPTAITNQWFPLRPGAQFVYVGKITQDGERVDHRVVFTVTDLTKEIDGVRSVVLYDLDYNAGQLAEAEIAFHAQDDHGNVWNMGEYPEEYENGKLTGAPDTWITGLAGARAGVIMRAAPRTGTSSYLQGWAPAIDFNDTAKVLKTGQKTCVPARCYQNVLVTDEWNPDEPDAHQQKFYAPGVGNVRAEFAGSEEKEKEVLELVHAGQLDPAALAKVRAAALAMDTRAYRTTKGLYRPTPPAQQA